MEEKRKYKEKVQKQKAQGDFTKSNVKGQKAVYQNDLNFNKSRALRRYRVLMEGVKPNSEFDKYSMRGQKEYKIRNQLGDIDKSFKLILILILFYIQYSI